MSDPAQVPMATCSKCGTLEAEHLINADGECEICAALMNLKLTLIKLGRLRQTPRELWERKDSQLPPQDRE